MNPLATLLLNVLVAAGNELLKKELPLVRDLGSAMIVLGENALGILGDSTIPFDQKKLLWEQDLDAVNAAWARCKDEVPSLVNMLLNSIVSLAFEALLGNVV